MHHSLFFTGANELNDFLHEEGEKDCPGYDTVFLREIKVILRLSLLCQLAQGTNEMPVQ